jgi:hypothetical protein
MGRGGEGVDIVVKESCCFCEKVLLRLEMGQMANVGKN